MLVVGVGNELRGDDGAGIAAVRRLSQDGKREWIDFREHQGEPIGLLEVWQGWEEVVLVDSMRSGSPPGTIRRFDPISEPLPAQLGGSSSTHAFALEQTIELGRALRKLPRRLVVFTAEGRTFEAGAGLSPELEQALPALGDAVLREAADLRATN